MVDAKLPDGSRLHAVIPPLALRGPTLSIRRFKSKIMQFEDMVRNWDTGSRDGRVPDRLREGAPERAALGRYGCR